MRFRAEQRLRRQRDFRAVRERGRRFDCGVFLLWWHRRETEAGQTAPTTARLGVSASIASVGPAVQRNRAKRRLREVFRRHQDLVPADCDLLLVARAALNRLAYGELEQKFVSACHKIFPPANA
ncbi:MAG TPA: ribonuclease P protein component [Opitutaceae bacterium]|nr:ribonuclease P protein component [Opitutaceae bacterium]